MGLLINGQWHDQWYDTSKTDGAFQREDAAIRHWITADGSAGPSGDAGFKAESGRYHLYVSLACPWAHRTLIFRELKGLQEHISVSVVSPDMLSQGWEFDTEHPDPRFRSNGDELFNSRYLHQIYTRHKPDYSGRVTVPVLWDKQRNCIVSNESSEIIRMFNSAFDQITGNSLDFYPQALRADIDAINERIYHRVNNGVYKAGFATAADKYEAAVSTLFAELDQLDTLLAGQRWLVNDALGQSHLTEADWRLFTTLVRFDAVYFGHFKCNLQLIRDYPALSRWMKRLQKLPGVMDTVNLDHIKRHYYFSHDTINPTRIVPVGPRAGFLPGAL
ncbi:glutathione S-transferase family protein [Parathalassolituus penaei]|uniref:Glutathione S-transferase family protein n=1 Tax=Parathalassolituus penaei TaxID=2997323 RepID=A0A9X3ELK7_9GAMM|nr:glutathione S-transferase family protein [Parathalassolituus penaei]MCY0964888.1 glutathione S-transferase family protein [Parathalassolituus penaei]